MRRKQPTAADLADIERSYGWLFRPDVLLAAYRSGWEDTANPYFAWEAIGICSENKREFPDWVRGYLADCAKRMTAPAAAQSHDLRKVLPGIFGFPLKPGAGHLLRPDNEQDYMIMAEIFASEIAKGAKPSKALNDACVGLKGKLDEKDDKTLLNHIKKIFDIKNTPRTAAEWNQQIYAWHLKVLLGLQKLSREFPP